MPHYRRVETETAFRAALAEEPWDIIIADYILPGFSGIAAIRIARESGIDLPIVMVSGKMSEETAVEAMRASAQDFLLKGNLARLVPAIQRELHDAQLRREGQQAEEELRATRQRMSEILESIQVALYTVDHDWHLTYINQRAIELWHKQGEDLLGKYLWAVFPEIVGSTTDHQLQRAMHQRQAVLFETFSEMLHAWVEVHAYPGADGGLTVNYRDINERKLAEKALRESESWSRMLAAVVENSNDFIGISTPELQPIYVNEAGCRMVGLDSMDEVKRTRVLDYFWPEDLPHIQQEAIPALQRDGRWVGDVRFRHFKTGAPIYTRWSVVTICDEAGKAIAYATISPDLTKLKEVEEALRESEATLRQAEQIAHIGNWHWDSRTNAVRWSAEFDRMLNIPPQPATFELALSLMHPDDREGFLHAVDAALQEQTYFTYDFRSRMPDGTVRFIHNEGEVLLDENGKSVGMFGTAQDITERVQADSRLRLLSTAVESAYNGIVITDAEGTFIWINPSVTRMTGYTQEEAIGQNPRILNSGQQSREFYEKMWATICSGQPWHGQLVNRRKDGTLYNEEMTISPVCASSNDVITHFVAIKEDITARKQVEQERERLLTEVAHRAVELDAILDAIIDPTAAFDANGMLIRANPAMVLTIGHEPIGMTHTEIARV